MNEARFRSCFGTGEVRAATADGRHPGSGMRTPFTRPPRNRSWRPSSQDMGLAPKGGPRRRARRRRQGRQRRSVSFTRGGRKRRPARRYRAPKWEARREARFSPVSSASGGPSLPVPAPRVFGRAGERAKKTLARMSTEPRGSGTRAVLGQAPKGPAREIDRRAGKRREARVLEWERFRSAEVDRSHRRSRRPWALPSAPRTRAT